MPTILVVDDGVDTLGNMADLLGEQGYAIDAAVGEDFVLEKARYQPCGVGLLDLRMPGMDGLTLCRRLRPLQPRMATVIVTAYAGRGVAEAARAAGARHVLARPIDYPGVRGPDRGGPPRARGISRAVRPSRRTRKRT